VPIYKQVNRGITRVAKHRIRAHIIFFGFKPTDKKLHGYGKDAYVQVTKAYRGN
jgi:hypothetical protein